MILRFTDFKLDGTGYGDYVKVYDGLEENPRRLLRVLTAFDSRAPVAVVSSSGQLRVHFYADKINAARGFNVTYQVCYIGFTLKLFYGAASVNMVHLFSDYGLSSIPNGSLCISGGINGFCLTICLCVL